MRQTIRALVATVAVAALLGSGAVVSPSNAEARTIRDAREGSASGDIRRVTLTNREPGLTVAVEMRRLESKRIQFLLEFEDGRGAPFQVYVWNIRRKRHIVRTQVNAGDPYTGVACPGLKQIWVYKNEVLRIFVPRRCGSALSQFSVTAYRPRGVITDWVESPRRLPYS